MRWSASSSRALEPSDGGVMTLPRQGEEGASPLGEPMPTSLEATGEVEEMMMSFIPKMAALRREVSATRFNELQAVLRSLEEGSDLAGVFGQVDGLLGALENAIVALKGEAVDIRNSEVRDEFDQQWVERRLHGDAFEPHVAQRESEGGGTAPPDTMMEVHVVGLSHHKAPVEVREKLAVAQPMWNEYAQELVEFARVGARGVISEVAVLSTCNRFEIYFAAPVVKRILATECVRAFLREKTGLVRAELDEYLFTHSAADAVQHLFEVSSGLDSLVVGEAQILAQVKACHEHCIQRAEDDQEKVAGSGGKFVSRLTEAGIHMGKSVRSKTDIGKGSVSVSSAAVELMIMKAMRDLRKSASKARVCILGAGKMSRLLLLALFSKFPDADVTVVNRSPEKAEALLEDELVKGRGGANAKVASTDRLQEVISQSDVVFTATNSEVPVVLPAHVEGREKAIMLVDISMPRNVSDDCAEVSDVHSYTVDDLKQVMEANKTKRKAEITKAERLIAAEVKNFMTWVGSQGAAPYLAALHSRREEIRQAAVEKTRSHPEEFREKEVKALDNSVRRLIDKQLFPMYYSIKEPEDQFEKLKRITALRELMALEAERRRS